MFRLNPGALDGRDRECLSSFLFLSSEYTAADAAAAAAAAVAITPSETLDRSRVIAVEVVWFGASTDEVSAPSGVSISIHEVLEQGRK